MLAFFLISPIISLLLIFASAICSLAVMILATIEVVKSKKSDDSKALWILGIWLLLGLLGVILYYFIGREKKQ
ncbi:MAG: PLDc N-terminal domain-containing protein [Candidatus Micrarchaeota archaeon]